MRNFFKSAAWIVLGLAVVLAGCERQSSAPPVALRIALYRSQDYLSYYVMREQGFDKQNGLNFTEYPVAGGAPAIEAIVAGKTDMSMAAIVPLLTAAERGLIPGKLVVVAANNFAGPAHRGVGVMIANTLQGWKDLEGKKIGTNVLNSILTVAVDIHLKQEGVSGYSFLEIRAANRGLALAGGNIAAAAMTEPYLTQSLLRGDGKLLGWVIGVPPFERMEFSNIVFSAEMHRRNPEGVKAFLRAHLAAARWINEHPDQARLVLARRLNLSSDAAMKIKLLHWPVDARSDPVVNDQTQQVLLRHGLIQRPFDTRTLYDETLLAAVLKEKQ